ncbi:MAG: L-threonylcarbamoyladenylate synthase [Verrucomicrobiota bacterium]|nr:L-threonylcarbamoyladenylate synthase [Verrucomicrobiota bacterium]
MNTELLPAGSPEALERAVERAAALLLGCETVALPTETVYGLAADALRPEAVLKIFEAKERPLFDPLIVHLPERAWLERVTAIPAESRELVEALTSRFWPGPLTLVLPRQAIVPDLVTSGLPTVAVRVSAHPVFREVIARVGKPLAAPSANRFGRISPTAAAHVLTELDGRIPLIVDGGASTHGIESTIIVVEGGTLRVLRAGPVTPGDLVQVQVELWQRRGRIPSEHEAAEFLEMVEASQALPPRAPGQLGSHYAPRTHLILVDTSLEFTWHPATMRIGLLGWSHVKGEDYSRFAAVEWLSPSGDLREAAATLFAKMRRLDEAGLNSILAERVPEKGLGIAIMDRLRKAATSEAPTGRIS